EDARLPEDCREEIALAPLDRDGAEELIEGIFAGGEIPPAAKRAIEARAGGNPLYIGEGVRSLLDQGAAERRAGALCATPRIDARAIPETVGEVIMSRLDRLPARARGVLQVAAILGRGATRAILERTSESGDLEADMALLHTANLLVPQERRGE